MTKAARKIPLLERETPHSTLLASFSAKSTVSAKSPRCRTDVQRLDLSDSHSNHASQPAQVIGELNRCEGWNQKGICGMGSKRVHRNRGRLICSPSESLSCFDASGVPLGAILVRTYQIVVPVFRIGINLAQFIKPNPYLDRKGHASSLHGGLKHKC